MPSGAEGWKDFATTERIAIIKHALDSRNRLAHGLIRVAGEGDFGDETGRPSWSEGDVILHEQTIGMAGLHATLQSVRLATVAGIAILEDVNRRLAVI